MCIVDHEEIISHITDFFSSFYTGEEWVRPSLDNLVFNSLGEEEASWLDWEFSEDEVEEAILWEGTKHSGRWFPLVFLLEVLALSKGGSYGFHQGVLC